MSAEAKAINISQVMDEHGLLFNFKISGDRVKAVTGQTQVNINREAFDPNSFWKHSVIKQGEKYAKIISMFTDMEIWFCSNQTRQCTGEVARFRRDPMNDVWEPCE
jgi:hypothetical protein